MPNQDKRNGNLSVAVGASARSRLRTAPGGLPARGVLHFMSRFWSRLAAGGCRGSLVLLGFCRV
jgi:hypothetical protein